jgi:hypothetical protein
MYLAKAQPPFRAKVSVKQPKDAVNAGMFKRQGDFFLRFAQVSALSYNIGLAGLAFSVVERRERELL